MLFPEESFSCSSVFRVFGVSCCCFGDVQEDWCLVVDIHFPRSARRSSGVRRGVPAMQCISRILSPKTWIRQDCHHRLYLWLCPCSCTRLVPCHREHVCSIQGDELGLTRRSLETLAHLVAVLDVLGDWCCAADIKLNHFAKSARGSVRKGNLAIPWSILNSHTPPPENVIQTCSPLPLVSFILRFVLEVVRVS